MAISVGDRVPEATLTIMTPEGPVQQSSTELLGTGKLVLFAVPAPFTPTCSASHLPGFIEHAQAILKTGVRQIVCMAVQDIFVMDAWGKSTGTDSPIVMAADGNGDFTRALGLELNATAFGLGYRSQRFAMVLEDGVIGHLMVDNPGEFRVSSAEAVLARL